MGRLGDQDVRDRYETSLVDIKCRLRDFKVIANEEAIPLEIVVDVFRTFEYARRTDVMIQSGDYHDEHMAGIGEKLDTVAAAIESIGENSR